MSGKKKRQITLFLVAVCISTFQPCRSVSLGKLDDDLGANNFQESTASGWIQLDPPKSKLLPDSIETTEQKQYKSDWPGLKTPEIQVSPFEDKTILRKLGELSSEFTLKGLTWKHGNVSKLQRLTKSKTENAYQSDFTGFRAVQGDILGVSPDTTHLSEWLAMRPLVHCDNNVMTFTASGGGFTNLFVDTDEGSPVSLFNLPSFCGYSVKTTWGDLEMTMPYDACYFKQENGRSILPVVWWGSPLKLSCPRWRPLPTPTVYCSPYGILVEIVGHEEDLPTLGVKVNGRWGPLVAEECASLVNSQPERFLFFISTSASCITTEHGVHLWLIIDELEYTLTCPPFNPIPPPPPSDYPFIPDPMGPMPTFPPPPQAPTQQAFDPVYLHPKFPQIYPPGPQLLQPPQPAPGSPPGLQPPQIALSMSYFEDYIKPYQPQPVTMPSPATPAYDLAQDRFSFLSNLAVSQSNVYYPYAPYFYSELSPEGPIVKPTVPPSTPQTPNLYFHPYYYIAPQTTPAPPPTPMKEPFDPLQLLNVVYPLQTDSSYNAYLFSQQTSDNLLPPSLPPPEKLHEPYFTVCSPSGSMVCTQYANPYYPYYDPSLSPIYPWDTMQQPTLPTNTPPTTSYPAPQAIQHYCPRDRIVVLLPFAHPDSIQVKDPTNTWLYLSNVSPFCGYNLQMTDNDRIVLHSPLPGCHSYSQPPMSTSLSLRFWDMSLMHYRTVDIHCPRQTPPPFTQVLFPTPPGTSGAHKPEVFCSPHHMTAVLPAGPISEILVKDVNGNKLKLQDVPKDCGYSASISKDGKIHLSLPLQLRCHMHLQGTMHIITILYTTSDGTREAQLSCPGVVPSTGQECNLPSEQRLPCGPRSVSQPQCLSMGCCFSKHPRACYYPMDECTADRHFVFSVPSSLTEPPLSPALLVAGNNSSCKPRRVTSDYALFKIPMDECGARRMQVGKTVIYMLEVNNVVNSISLNYGTITRDSPVRLLVECRFLPGNALTVSYLVKTPTLGPAVQTQGAFGVQLRIAKDPQYKSYHPQYHQPLQMLLGKPLYLEVRLLNSPDPSLVLLVHYCVAYPRSGKAVWVLLYNGCPNPLDPDPQQVVLSDPHLPSRAQTRRFTISTFQFLPDGEFKDPNEERDYLHTNQPYKIPLCIRVQKNLKNLQWDSRSKLSTSCVQLRFAHRGKAHASRVALAKDDAQKRL